MSESELKTRKLVVGMLTGFAGQKSGVFIPWVFFKWMNRDHPLAIFFSQCLHWHAHTDHPEKWFALTQKQWDEETGMGRAQIERAAVILEQVGLERELKRSRWHDGLPVVHFRFDEEKLFNAATAFFERGETLQKVRMDTSRQKLKSDRAAKSAEKRKRGMSADNNPDLSVTNKRRSNLPLKREMSAALKENKESSTGEEKKLLASASANAPTPAENPYPVTEPTPTSQTAQGKAKKPKPATTPLSPDGAQPPFPKVNAPAEDPEEIESEAREWEAMHRGDVAENIRRYGIEAGLDISARNDVQESGWLEKTLADVEARRVKRLNRKSKTTAKVSAAAELAAAMSLIPVGDDWAVFGKVAGKLNKATIPCEEFKAYVEYWSDRAAKERWTLTVNALVGAGRMSQYVARRTERAHLKPYVSPLPPFDMSQKMDEAEFDAGWDSIIKPNMKKAHGVDL